MSTSRERVAAVLALTAQQLAAHGRINLGLDSVGETTIAVMVDRTRKLRETCLNEAPAPLDPATANEIHQLAQEFERAKLGCSSTIAAGLQYESDRLHAFLATSGVDVDSDMQYRFRT